MYLSDAEAGHRQGAFKILCFRRDMDMLGAQLPSGLSCALLEVRAPTKGSWVSDCVLLCLDFRPYSGHRSSEKLLINCFAYIISQFFFFF